MEDINFNEQIFVISDPCLPWPIFLVATLMFRDAIINMLYILLS